MSKHHTVFLLYSIVLAVILGAAAGWYMGEKALMFAWMGTLFLNSLKMVVVPLIVAAIISGVASLGDVRKLGRPGTITFIYYISTTIFAVTVGMVLAELILPGNNYNLSLNSSFIDDSSSSNGLSNVLLSFISPNIIASAAKLEVLPLIVFSIIFGSALTVTGEKGQIVTNFFEGLNSVMMVIVGWIMYLSPFGIFSLVAAPIAEAGGGVAVLETFTAVGSYLMTVLGGLLIHSIALFAILVILAGRGKKYLRDVMPALITALSTSSSSATVPLSMECATGHGLMKNPVRLMIPLGSTINMNGTAVYQGVAVIFLAQVYGVNLIYSDYVLVAITAAMAAIGSAGIPQGGHIMTLMLFSVVGIPAEGFGLLLGVDWFLDRARTSINVWGDLVGAAVLDRFMKFNKLIK